MPVVKLLQPFELFPFLNLLIFAPGRLDHIKNARKLIERLVHALGSFHFN